MKRTIVCALLVLLPACSLLPTDGDTQQARLGDEFTLRQGARAAISDARVSVQFVEVVRDQRCREGTQCLGVGGYTVRLRVVTPDQPAETMEIQAFGEGTATVRGYAFRVKRLFPDPPPRSSDPAYRLLLGVDAVYSIH
jgi:hypothetical protein